MLSPTEKCEKKNGYESRVISRPRSVKQPIGCQSHVFTCVRRSEECQTKPTAIRDMLFDGRGMSNKTNGYQAHVFRRPRSYKTKATAIRAICLTTRRVSKYCLASVSPQPISHSIEQPEPLGFPQDREGRAFHVNRLQSRQGRYGRFQHELTLTKTNDRTWPWFGQLQAVHELVQVERRKFSPPRMPAAAFTRVSDVWYVWYSTDPREEPKRGAWVVLYQLGS